MKKRVAVQLIETLNCGGTENNLLRLLPRMEKEGWHNVVVTFGSGGEMLSQFQDAGIEVVVLDTGHFLKPKTVKAVAEAIKKIKPDIVITNLVRADILGRIFLPRVTPFPIVSYLHTTYNHSRYWSARFFEWLTKPWARHYIANAPAVRDFYNKHLGVPLDKLTVVAGGVDIEAFQKASAEPIRKELKIPQQSFVVTCVGNLAPNKGQASLITAFETIFTKVPNAYLLLIGEGEERENLELQKKQSPAGKRIHLLGRRTDVAGILKASDVFSLPTLFEGLSVALLEAMAAGKTILTTDIPENRVILKNNVSALLVPPADTPALTKALRKLYEDKALRQRLATAALEDVTRGYSMASFAAKFAETLTTLSRKLS